VTAAPRIPFELRGLGRWAPAAPSGKRLIVSVVLNVEYWPITKQMPRTILSAPHGLAPTPDVPNWSWAEYGMRYGLPRIVDLLVSRNIAASVNINSSVIDVYRPAAELLRDAGLEFVGHGVEQETLHNAANERAVIRQSLDELSEFTGTRVRGWLGPGLQETEKTPDLLSEEGVDYVCDWVLDELPVMLEARPRPLVAVPYSLELNDSVVFAVERHSSGELLRRVTDTLRLFDDDDDGTPMVLSLPVHPHILGVRHRFPYLRETIEMLCERSDVVFMSCGQICDWYRASL
jgi:allantoinase